AGRVALGSPAVVVAATCRHARETRCPGRATPCRMPGVEFPGTAGRFVVMVSTTGGDEHPARGGGGRRGPAGGPRPTVRRARRVGEVAPCALHPACGASDRGGPTTRSRGGRGTGLAHCRRGCAQCSGELSAA